MSLGTHAGDDDGEGDHEREQVTDDGDQRRADSVARAVEAHPAQVDGEQRGDEGPDPGVVERFASALLDGHAVGERRELGLLGQGELGEHGVAGVGRREHR